MSNVVKTTQDDVEKSSTDPRERVAILIDTSGSMSGLMPQGDRKGHVQTKLHAAIEASQVILQASRPDTTLYGLLSFSDECTLYAEITDDFSQLYAVAYDLKLEGGTAMDIGIMASTSTNPNRIILLSDGQPDDSEKALEAARLCATLSIKIDTVGIGDADNDLLREISRLTGGIFKAAETVEELVQIFASLETEARLALTYEGTEGSVIKL